MERVEALDFEVFDGDWGDGWMGRADSRERVHWIPYSDTIAVTMRSWSIFIYYVLEQLSGRKRVIGRI